MPAVSLPLTFNNSFWSQDYRHGLEVIFGKLQEGCVENDEVLAFVKARVAAEKTIAASLTNPGPTGPRGQGFDVDDGATLLMAFRGLQEQSKAQGDIHKGISRDLERLIVEPFGEWAERHKERVNDSRTVLLDGWVNSFEQGRAEIARLQKSYQTKMRRADEAEDDAKFAMTDIGDKYTAPIKTSQNHGTIQRSATMTERLTQRLASLRKPQDALNLKEESVIPVEHQVERVGSPEPMHAEESSPKVDKGKGKAVDPPSPTTTGAPPKLNIPENPLPPPPPSPIVLAGIPLNPDVVESIIERAKAELPLRPIRFPLIGEYQDCFSGLELAEWIKNNVQGVNGDGERAELFASELGEKQGVLRRLGEIGNRFEAIGDAYYQFRTPKRSGPRRRESLFNASEIMSPSKLLSPTIAPAADTIVKTSKNLLNVVQQAVGAGASNEPVFVRTRREAEAAEEEYRTAVRKLDRQRLGLEERIEDTLKVLQRWEGERLRAVKTVLLQYQGTLSELSSGLHSSNEKQATLIATYQPEQDLIALIERYKTGPFKPWPQVFESIEHERDTVFGVDLRQWAGEGGWNAIRSGQTDKPQVPAVLVSLLAALKTKYETLPDATEKRKAWIYDVPLIAVHHLREAIVALPPDKPIPAELILKYDAPVIASCIRLWFMELDPPFGLWEGWDEIKTLYPNVGISVEAENMGDAHIDALKVTLEKLPRVHLLVLDALVQHLKELIDSTDVEGESKDLYLNKLGLSFGRALLRPKVENDLSIQSRHPTLFVMDIITHHTDILPPVLAKKKRESDSRPLPIRKRTRPVDVRMSRSRLSVGADPQMILQAQLAAKGGLSRNSSPTRAMSPPARVSSPSARPMSPPALPTTPKPAEEATTPKVVKFNEKPAVIADDLPPRPNFVEPPVEGNDLPPRPVFAEPPPEIDDENAHKSSNVVVHPPTPISPLEGTGTSPTSTGSTSPSRLDESSVGASLKRSTSGENRVRGPRVARGTRPLSHVPGKPSISRAADPSEFAPRKHGGAAAAGAFSRRTQESDAEDNVVGR